MSKEEIKKVFEELKTDPRAKELIGSQGTSSDRCALIQIYAEAAQKLGFEVTPEELSSYIKEQEKVRGEKTRESASEIMNLDDEVLDQVAGGKKEKDECKDTYRDRENCWVTDACDIVLEWYDGYECHALGSCQETEKSSYDKCGEFHRSTTYD